LPRARESRVDGGKPPVKKEKSRDPPDKMNELRNSSGSSNGSIPKRGKKKFVKLDFPDCCYQKKKNTPSDEKGTCLFLREKERKKGEEALSACRLNQASEQNTRLEPSMTPVKGDSKKKMRS